MTECSGKLLRVMFLSNESGNAAATINADNIKGYFLSTSGRLVGVDRHGIVTTTLDTQNYCIEIVQQVGKNDFLKKAI